MTKPSRSLSKGREAVCGSSLRVLMAFIAQLRELSGGKPVGLKTAVGHRFQFLAIVKAMIATGEGPDFIVIDGGEGGTGAAPSELSDHVGLPLTLGLSFAESALVGAGVRDRLKLGASGKLVSGYDLCRAFAIGADYVLSARDFMFAIGCIQSRTCHTNRCPTGVATQDPLRQSALVVVDKAERVYNFHRLTLKALSDMLGAAGLSHPDELKAHHLVRRVSATEIKQFSELHVFLEPGSLLDGQCPHTTYVQNWARASAETFGG